MNTLDLKLNEIEQSIHELKKFNVKIQPNDFYFYAAIICCGFTTVTVSILLLPEWASISLLFVFCSVLLLYKLRGLKETVAKFDNTNSRIEEISLKFGALKSEITASINDYENRLSELPSLSVIEEKDNQIKELQAALENASNRISALSNVSATVNVQDPYKYGGYTGLLLEVIQKLDFEVEDFGEECAAYLRKQFTRVLGTCGLRFVDYSENDKDFFNTEATPAIDKVDCTRRAIVKGDNDEVIMYGRAFIPKTNNL